MASARKKVDENNVKTLRELGALPQNKFCFDCGQRGPTYVNVTIGSFVCTKCSGMLRGLTPPHRVKSISMATFNSEEIDTLREKGNDFCRRTWLGLYEGTLPSHSDEQGVRDFMVEKYERKRYYLEKSMTHHHLQEPNNRTHLNGSTKMQINGFSRTININNNSKNSNSTAQNGLQRQNALRSRPEVKNSSLNNNLSSHFPVDFDRADIFSNSSTNSSKSSSSSGTPQNGFANFDGNPVFDSSTKSNKDISNGSPWSVQSTQPQVNGLYPTINGTNQSHTNNGIPSNMNGLQPTVNGTPPTLQNGNVVKQSAPSLTQPNQMLDKYAALKHLDEEMKSQTQSDVWSSSNGGSTGSLYSSPTPTTGSAYGSPSSQGSLFGSPSQGQFLSAFSSTQDHHTNGNLNPFNAGAWGANAAPNPTNNTNGFAKFNGNVFNNESDVANAQKAFANFNGNGKSDVAHVQNAFANFNGMSMNGNMQTNGNETGLNGQSFFNPFKQQDQNNAFANFGAVFPQTTGGMVNGGTDAWGGNPFKVSSNTGMANSSNPFL